jgi:formate dehydrogenase subunit gamma
MRSSSIARKAKTTMPRASEPMRALRLTVPKAALAALLAAAAGVAIAQQGAGGTPSAGAATESLQPAPAASATIQVVPNDGTPIVLPPGSKATITTNVLPEPQPTDSNAQRARSQPLNNAPFWRGVHNSGVVPGTVNNLEMGERGVLIQPITTYPGTRATTAGEAWRQMRNWWIIPIGGLIVLLVVAAVALYYWLKGPIGGHGRHTGRVIERFTYFERVVHWSTAITFTILAVSGAVMSFGKFLLLPIMGGALFGWLTWALKTLHNVVGPLFAISAVIMFITYLPSNLPSRDDIRWLARVGGMLGGEHPPSGRFNAGEKIVFWGGLLVLSAFVIASGFVLDKIVPGLDLTRPQMQVAHIVHAVASMFIIAMFIGHAYMGTIGVTGSWRAMKTGYVDEGWAEEHHKLWADDIAAGKVPAQRSGLPPVRERPAA